MPDQNNQDQSPLIAVSQLTTEAAEPADNNLIESTLTTEDMAANTDEGLIGFFAEETSTEMNEEPDLSSGSFSPNSMVSQLTRTGDGYTNFGEMGIQINKTKPVGVPDYHTPPEFTPQIPRPWPRFGGQTGMSALPNKLPTTGLNPDDAYSRLLVLNVLSGTTRYQAYVEVSYSRIRTISHQQLITAQLMPSVMDVALRDIFPCYVLTLEKQYAKRLFTIAPALFTMLFDNDTFKVKIESTDKYNVWYLHVRADVTNSKIHDLLQRLHTQLVSGVEFLSNQEGLCGQSFDLSKAGL